jgi:hypothetical protein
LTSGIDGVSEMVKRSAQYVIKLLTNICNASFEAGIFSDKLKMAVVKPLYKKGNRKILKTTDQYLYYQCFKKL